MELELRINGVIASQNITPGESLLTLLRREGYSSVKHGCETGDCGACTVQVDGLPRPSCVMLAAQAGGCAITTVESMGNADNLSPLQAAFVEVGAVQCGFCMPGMLLSASALLMRNSSPAESDVRDALSGNLCRCADYARPVQAVLRAAAVLRGEKVAALEYQTIDATEEAGTQKGRSGTLAGSHGMPRAVSSGVSSSVTMQMPALTASAALPAVVPGKTREVQVVGQAIPAINALKLVTGVATFAGDITRRNMLYGRILTSPHANAIIRSIDVSQARALPGVHAVLTYKDVPRTPYSGVASAQAEPGLQDQYCLDSIVRYVGDRVAVIAAETPEVAEQALGLIRVDYDVLPAILDVRQALEPVAPRVHPEVEARGIYDASRNIAARIRSDIGDVEQGFAQSYLVVEGEYLTPPVQLAPLENHTVVTYFDEENKLVVRTNTHAPQHVRRTLARILGLQTRHIRVVKPEVGGSFGLRQELVLEDLCALLTLATRQPVKLEYTRADEFRSSRSYQQYIVRIKTGVKRDGKIVANQLMLLADTGAYGTHTLISRTGAASAMELYPCPNMRFVAEVLYTNHSPAGSFQGQGIPQEFFALECHIDEIARQLGIDALEFRRKNWVKAGDACPMLRTHPSGRDAVPLLESCGLAACLRTVEEKLRWDERHRLVEEGHIRHGVGIALALHCNSGAQADTSGAIIKLNDDGSFDLFAAPNDNGNGSATLIVQMAAEVLAISVDDILLHTSGTDIPPFETGVSDSSTLYASGGAVKKAAEQMRRQILSVAGRMLNVLPEALKLHRGVIVAPNEKSVSISQVAEYALYNESRHIMTTASWKVPAVPTTFAAQGVKIEVDTETGTVRVLNVVTAVDCGNPINPQIIEGQIQGSVARALGLSISEEMMYDQKGALLTLDLNDAHIFTAPEMPEAETYLVETSDPSGPFAVKSVADIALYGIAPAIANALVDAIGVKVRQLPLSPERVLRAIHAQAPRRS